MKMERSDYLIPSGTRIERLLFEPYERQMKDALSIKSYLEDFIQGGLVTEHHALGFRLYYMVISGFAAEEPHHSIPGQIKNINILLSEREYDEFRKLYSLELAVNLVETLREFLLENFKDSMCRSKTIIDWLDSDETFKIEDNFKKPTPDNNFDLLDLLELTDDLLRMIHVVSSWMMKTENEFREREVVMKKIDSLSRSLIARDVPSWLSVLSFSLCKHSLSLLSYKSIRSLIEKMNRPIEIYERCVSKKKFSFNRHQLSIAGEGLFERANLLVSCPPGSGKTFLASLQSVINECNGHSGKTIFAVPLIALANEVHSLIESIAPDYVPTTLQTSESSLKKYKELAKDIEKSKIVVATYERLDSIIRNDFLSENDIHTLLIDEFHNIANKTRGISLDFLSSSLLDLCKEKLLLSAVIPKQEVENLAKWTNTKPIITEEREKKPEIEPAKLRSGETKKNYLLRHSKDSIQNNHLTLVVCSTRQRCENLAEWVANIVEGFEGSVQMTLSPDSDYLESIKKRKRLREEFAGRVLELEIDPRKEYERIAEVIQKGVAFHHAGMNPELRKIIEEAASQKAINVLFSTTTLVEGINLPIKDILLHSIPYLRQITIFSAIKQKGKNYLSSKETKLINGILSTYIQNLRNVIGRAGRPRMEYSPKIISLLSRKNNKQLESLEEFERIGTSIDLYVLYDFLAEFKEKIGLKGDWTERNYQEGREKMRSWLLRLIDVSGKRSALRKRISKSWFSWRFANDPEMLDLIEKKIFNDVNSLCEEGFVEKNDSFVLSKLGQITSASLIDPESALTIFNFMTNVLKRHREGALARYVERKQEEDSNYSEDKLIRILILIAMGLSNELIREYRRVVPYKLTRGDKYQMERLEELSLLPPEDDSRFSRFFYAANIATLLSQWRGEMLVEKIEEYANAKSLAERSIKRMASDESVRVLNFISRAGSEILMFPEQFSKIVETLSWQLQFGTFNFDTAELIEFLTKKKLGTRETAIVIAKKTKEPRKMFNLGNIKEKHLDELSQKFGNIEKAKIIFEELKKETR